MVVHLLPSDMLALRSSTTTSAAGDCVPCAVKSAHAASFKFASLAFASTELASVPLSTIGVLASVAVASCAPASFALPSTPTLASALPGAPLSLDDPHPAQSESATPLDATIARTLPRSTLRLCMHESVRDARARRSPAWR
jgi:hypothetical protein